MQHYIIVACFRKYATEIFEKWTRSALKNRQVRAQFANFGTTDSINTGASEKNDNACCVIQRSDEGGEIDRDEEDKKDVGMEKYPGSYPLSSPLSLLIVPPRSGQFSEVQNTNGTISGLSEMAAAFSLFHLAKKTERSGEFGFWT